MSLLGHVRLHQADHLLLLCTIPKVATAQWLDLVVLSSSGEEQPEISQQARAAIFERKERAVRCTLPSRGTNGFLKWTLFEMFPNVVSFLTCPLHLRTSCQACCDMFPLLQRKVHEHPVFIL